MGMKLYTSRCGYKYIALNCHVTKLQGHYESALGKSLSGILSQ